ncbi:MAG: M56 family metallopeptidase [Myxococcota bacterium]
MGPALAAFVPTAAGMAWLLSASVKAALVLAAAWVGAMLLRRSTAAARHQVWALGVAGALVLPLLCWALPSVPLSLGTPTSGAGRSLLATAVLLTGDGLTGDGLTGDGLTADGTPRALPAWPAWLALTWASGALLVSLRFLRGYLAAGRLWRAAAPANVEAWMSARRDAAAALGISRDVALGRSEAIGSPMTIGVLRPRVLLPAAADDWSPPRLRAVLLHELGHVRRHDTLIQLGAQVGCALYWWNPLIWLAAARLRVEREHACDDLVLGAGIRPSSYAADLLELARRFSTDGAANTGVVCMADPSGTEARLRRILDAAAPRRPLGASFQLGVRGATLAFSVTLACTSAAPLAGATPSEASRGTSAPATSSSGLDWEGNPTSHTYRATSAASDSRFSAELDRRMGALKQCYDRRLLVHPELSGVVITHWTIEPSGKVPESCVTEDSVGDAELAACVQKMVQMAWPAPSYGPIEVSLPFVFSPFRGPTVGGPEYGANKPR